MPHTDSMEYWSHKNLSGRTGGCMLAILRRSRGSARFPTLLLILACVRLERAPVHTATGWHRSSEKISVGMSDGLARVQSRRSCSQAIPQDCLPPHAGNARTNQKRIAGQRMRVVSRFEVPVVNVAVEDIVCAASKSRSGHVSPTTI